MVQTTLQKMVEAALAGQAGVKWGHILHYLDSHCQEDFSRSADSKGELPYSSPLPAYFVATEDLAKQLKADGVTGESVLRTALKGAPARVVAALCQLGPHALEATDHRGRLPLHLACRRSAEDPEIEKVMTIMADAFPLALMHRDDGGRTPLHWLFWYQAEHRSPELVTKFCQALPKAKFYTLKQRHDTDKKYPLPEIPRPSSTNKVPHNASIIPDARLGCLPLHYAIMEGASSMVIQALLQAYPLSKHTSDRFGRTGCHWYLGAGYLRAGCAHVSGEARDPNAPEWWDRVLSLEKLRLLMSSRVARTADCLNRNPLHWACELLASNYYRGSEGTKGKCLSIAGVQILLDHHIGQLIGKDHQSQTPLMVILDTVRKMQDKDWTENGGKGRVLDLVRGGPTAFDPPLEMMTMLLTYPDPMAESRPGSIEDDRGRLPIHAALSIASSPAIVELLIQTNPVSLVHTTEETLEAPLHAAFSRPCTAPLQSVETIELVLRTYTADKHGMMVDGRLPMKMEDAAGSYPIHYACKNKACVEVIKMLAERYPMTALAQNSEGDLPIQCLLDDDLMKSLTSTVPGVNQEESVAERFEINRQKIEALILPLLSDPSKLALVSSNHGMMPLHIAVLFESAPYSVLLRMLELYPEAASRFTSHLGGDAFSILDLHEFRKAKSEESLEDWKHIRELLFSFTPTLESHRHREELLDQCVRIIVDEMNDAGSYHLNAPKLPVVTTQVSRTMLPTKESPVMLSSMSMLSTTSSHKKMSRLPLRSKQKPAAKKSLAQRILAKKKANAASDSIYDDTDMTLDDYALSVSMSQDEDHDEDSYFSEEGDEETCTDDDDTYDDGSSVYGESTISYNSSFTPLQQLPSLRNATLSSDFGTVPSNAFDKAKTRVQGEEKKENLDEADSFAFPGATPTASNKILLMLRKPPSRPKFLSEVGLRLWTFLVLYCDTKNPSDNYVRKLADIFDQISFSSVGRIVGISLPSYAAPYLPKETELSGLSFRDIASPKCRELIHKTCYFVGKYDFRLDDAESRLIHLSSDETTVVVRAAEWIFTTEETTDAVNPGMSEAEIWATGERPAELGLTFHSRQRTVWIKFTKDAEVYKSEVGSRVDLDVPVEGNTGKSIIVAPLLSHFNALAADRKADRGYSVDINDERFSELDFFNGLDDSSGRDSICLKEYPFALVYAASGYGTLADYYRQHGMTSTKQIKKVFSQVSDSLKAMHSKGIIHADMSMRNVVFAPADETRLAQGRWLLNDVAHCCRIGDNKQSLGRISSQGLAQFSTGVLPPEAFVKLSPVELKAYDKYWRTIEREFGTKVDKDVTEPMVDFETGESYVVRCYFDFQGMTSPETIELPPLPYEALAASESVDIWGLGQMLFGLCAGRPLFPVSSRTGQLLELGGICNWSSEMAASLIYKYVADPLAQDILFQVLSPIEVRENVTLDKVMSHPFFSCADTSPPWIQHMIQKRKQETVAQTRLLQNKAFEVSDKKWLEERTVSINCWDFDLLARIHLSPTEIIRGMMERKTEIATPGSFLILPYKLCRNKKSQLTPSTKTNVDLSERMGAGMLALSKACYFADAIKKAISAGKKSTSMWWSSSEVLRVLALSSEDFGEVQAEMVELAARHVEAFRDNPMTVAIMVVQQRVRRVLSCFDNASAYLYVVDDFNGVPVVHGSSGSPFPLEITGEKREEILQRGILIMHLCCSYARGVAGGVSGLVKLIFEAADPHIPPSWMKAASGLDHKLDEAAIVSELRVLEDALGEMFDTRHRIFDDNLAFIHDYLLEVDPKRNVANMRRVTAGGGSLWTTIKGAEELEIKAQSFTFRDALGQISQVEAAVSVLQDSNEGSWKASPYDIDENLQKKASQDTTESLDEIFKMQELSDSLPKAVSQEPGVIRAEVSSQELAINVSLQIITATPSLSLEEKCTSKESTEISAEVPSQGLHDDIPVALPEITAAPIAVSKESTEKPADVSSQELHDHIPVSLQQVIAAPILPFAVSKQSTEIPVEVPSQELHDDIPASLPEITAAPSLPFDEE